MKKLTAKSVSIYISIALVIYGIYIHAAEAYDTVLFCREHFSERYTFPEEVGVFTESFLSGWIFGAIDSFMHFLPTAALFYLFVQLIFTIIHRTSKKRSAAPEAAEKKERKISGRLFIFSFLPAVLLFIYSSITMFTGAEEGLIVKETVYGLRAFSSSLFWGSIVLCIIPVFPIAVIYQIVFIIRTIKRRSEQSKPEQAGA